MRSDAPEKGIDADTPCETFSMSYKVKRLAVKQQSADRTVFLVQSDGFGMKSLGIRGTRVAPWAATSQNSQLFEAKQFELTLSDQAGAKQMINLLTKYEDTCTQTPMRGL